MQDAGSSSSPHRISAERGERSVLPVVPFQIHTPSPMPSTASRSISSLERRSSSVRILSAISIFISSLARESSMVLRSTCCSRNFRYSSSSLRDSSSWDIRSARSLFRLRRFRYSSKLSRAPAEAESSTERRAREYSGSCCHSSPRMPTNMPLVREMVDRVWRR